MFQIPKIIFTKTDETAQVPYRKSASHAGYILKTVESKIISEGESLTFDTGLKVEEMIKGVWGMILPIESLSKRHIKAIPFVLENDFKDELKITLYNESDESYYIEAETDIAKLVFMPLLTIEPEIKDE